MRRWDLVFDRNGPQAEPHFCREWVNDVGCYGTNPDHGYTWEEVREQIARWHLNAANEWIHKPEPSE